MQKILKCENLVSLDSIMYPYSTYTLSQQLWDDFPDKKAEVEYITQNRNSLTKKEKAGKLSNFRIITTNIFDLLPDLFFSEIPDNQDYIGIYGRDRGKRTHKYILSNYINTAENFNKYKVVISAADGAAGTVGKPIPARIVGKPVIEPPGIGYTQSFLGIGAFNSKDEAEACLKYIKSKFARALLGILKITQHNPPAKWKYVPLQDFTENSDIDWSGPVSEIDQQLYRKYGLDEEEIDFIEANIKEME